MKNGLEQEWVYVNYDSLTGQQQLAAFPLLFVFLHSRKPPNMYEWQADLSRADPASSSTSHLDLNSAVFTNLVDNYVISHLFALLARRGDVARMKLLIKQWRGKGGSPFVLMVSGFLALMVLEFKVTSLREWAFEILEDNTDNPHQCAKILGYERVMHEIDNRKWARARRGYTWQDCFLKYGLSGSLIVRKPKGSVQSVVAIRVRKETFLKQVKDGEGAILSPEYAKNLLAPSIELQQDE
ncbi:hypothetical protein BJ085DRAFT_28957 [Dimargaris cristalligena]|uniref:Uncharacterized protein n=1 Tax=Dimargaris cristalligena TaxID=215637 RepID=A0A4P9ZSE0_9FUNG|nr:hypothetical protein BJ085DRAFT_28957 [Dimargaris cristalligena]|eukprot:RKP35612.1 hypothetical protein BJ085DRAFT_28957 [Dimargaris cristalligena]